MVRKFTSHKVLRLIVGLFAVFVILVLLRFVPTVSSHTAQVEHDLDQQFVQHQLLQIDARNVVQQVRETGRTSIATADLSFDLELVPHDLRAPGYRAEEIGPDGVARPIDVGAVRTFKGRAHGRRGGSQLPQVGEARFTIDEKGIEGLIITPTEHYFVEPARKFSKAATTSEYVVYNEADVVTTTANSCGVTLSEQINEKAQTLTVAPTETSLAITAAGIRELRIATESDNEYVNSKGGAAPADQEILSILNSVEGIFEVELGLTIRVVYQSAWSTSNDPFSSTNPSALLGELTDFWNANRGSVARDVVHMWTGKQLDNATIGTAYLEALCRFTGGGRAAYGLSMGVASTQQVAITAHEIGHNLGATHPNQQVPPVTDCGGTVMASSVNTDAHLTLCQFSRDEISRYLATSTSCLNSGTSSLRLGVSSPLTVDSSPQAIVLADFNSDGKDDVASANGNGSVNVFLGSDDGVIQRVQGNPLNAGASPRSITAGDFDKDGRQDLAVSNGGSQNVSVFLGLGNGAFKVAPGSPVFANTLPGSITSADFTGDGILDLAVANLGAGAVSLLRGTGSGNFETPVDYVTGSSPTSLKTGDFNRDSRPDLAVANMNSGNVSILISLGSSGFNAALNYDAGGGSPRSLVTGDFSSDGLLDITVGTANALGTFYAVLRGNGDGTFLPPLVFVFEPPGFFANSLTAADFNGDGHLDIASTSETTFRGQTTGNVQVRLGLGTGNFNVLQPILANGIPKSIASGDLNGDGKLELLTANENNLSALFGNGDGRFQAIRLFTSGPRPVLGPVGDFNGDGKPDVSFKSVDDDFNERIRVLQGNGDGTFSGNLFSGPQITTLMFTKQMIAADFNNDGTDDIAAIATSIFADSTNVHVFFSDNGAFRIRRSFLVGPGTPLLQSGDVNGDHLPDLITWNGTNNVSLFLTTSANDFRPPITYSLSAVPSSVSVANINNDGIADLMIFNGVAFAIHMGKGDGSFQPGPTHNFGTSVTFGDFNGDGKLDGLLTDRFLVGRGDGTFQVIEGPGIGGALGFTGDFNGDHKRDLGRIVVNNSIEIDLGSGDGKFMQAGSFNVGHSFTGPGGGDFNGDGKLDFVVSFGFENNFTSSGLLGVILSSSGTTLNAPANDNFSSARVINGPLGTLPGSTVLATKQAGEPNHASASNGTGGASIWYRWTAPSTGRFYFQTFSSSFPNVLGVYTGTSLSTLTNVVKSSSASPEYVEFDAVADTTYQIAIDGVNGDTGRTVLSWNTGSLKNDNFAFAREIRGSSGSVNGDNTNFTIEPFEPTLPGAANAAFSAWYRWTAPNTGKVSFLADARSGTPCGDTTRLLGAYTGNFIDTLSPVAVNFDGYRDFDDPGACDNRSLRFNAVAGTTYRIQLRSVLARPFTLSWNYANPPPNDNFVNALILSGPSGSLVGTNRDATKEPGEPNHAGGAGGASIWYRWTAPASGPVTFDTIGFRNQTNNSFRYLTALMAVYTGSSLNSLTAVVTNATDNKVTFNATAGTTYQIAIDSAPYAGGGYLPGLVPLHWGAKQVANDDFANAQPLTASGSFVPLLGSNAGATKETGEPNHQGNAGGASVWYRWTALTSGSVSFVLNTCTICTLSASNALVSVYTGTSVNALTPVVSTADSNHTFTAVRGVTYFIAVDSRTTGGTYEFSLVSANISARNDAFANAQVLSGSAGAVAGDNSGASKEIAEPNHANDIGGASVWYQWKAPSSGLYTFDTFGSNFDTLVAVYTGNVVSALSTVASSDNAASSAQSRVTFDAKLNTTYFIAVDGKSNGVEQGTGLPRSQAGFVLLNWNNLPPPVNDNFANPQLLSGVSGNATGRNTVASKEGGEPNHAGGPGGVSVWYRWTAPGSGNFSFNTFGSDFNTLIGVYTGSALNTLTPVSSNDDVGGVTQSRVSFSAVAGTNYYIAIDGSVGVPGSVTPFSGNVVLSWFQETGVSNDNFVSAQALSGSTGSLAATNAGATKENGEPLHAGDRGGRSVWYTWTAPFSGPVLLTTSGSDFDTLLGVYTGTTLNQLTLIAGNDDSSYADNLGHILSSSLTFTATSGTTYRIAVDGSGGRFGNFALRWGADAKISGRVSFLGGVCGSDKKVTMILSGEDARAVTFTGSGSYSFQHLRVGGNYSVRGVSEISASCLPLFLERAQNAFPLAGDVLDANFVDDGLRGGGSTSNITGHVKNASGVALNNVAIALSGTASRTVYTDSAGLYLLPNLPAGTYQVTPSKAGVVFSPASRDFNFASGQTIIDADFFTQDSYNISGQTRDQNGVALSGVTVTLNKGTQPVTAQTDGNGFYAFDAAAGGSFTLTAAKAGLSFTPTTKTINGLSANQKNVDFTVTQVQTLTITSVNPNSGVTITVSPNDNNAQGIGTTQFTRTYNVNTTVSVTAPVTTGGNLFQKWLKDGADYSTDLATSVTLDANHTLTAVYLTTQSQTPAGQNIKVQLNGVSVSFATVGTAGTTTITPINPASAGQLPNGYQLTGNSIAFDISTTATVQPPISVCFNVPSITDASVFGQLRLLHNENGTLIDRTTSQDFGAKMICATVNSLSPFVLVSTTVQQLQLLLDESATAPMQATALDAVLLVRDPFPVVNTANLLMGADKNTRVLVFVRGLQLAPGETATTSVTVHLVDAQGQTFDVAGENLFSLAGFDFSQLTFRLPDTLAVGTCTIEVRAHGQVTNLGVIRIRL